MSKRKSMTLKISSLRKGKTKENRKCSVEVLIILIWVEVREFWNLQVEQISSNLPFPTRNLSFDSKLGSILSQRWLEILKSRMNFLQNFIKMSKNETATDFYLDRLPLHIQPCKRTTLKTIKKTHWNEVI